LSLGVFGLGGAFVMAVVLPRLVPLLGEWRTCAFGLTFAMVAAFGYAAAWQGWMIYVVMVSRCLEALADPPLRSLAAANVAPSAQGELQGAMTSLFSITAIITPLIYTQIFAAFTGPNAPCPSSVAHPMCQAAFFIAVSLAVFLLKVERPAAPAGEAEPETA
jgi:DHA1 family tetracycline resistance protein-like MFS transporter